MVWEPRTYRADVDASGLTAFEVVVAETDLQVLAETDLSAAARDAIVAVRAPLEAYVAAHPRFAESFVPVEIDQSAPEIVRAMGAAGHAAKVGPMAAVAGAVAERVARMLAPLSAEVIVENGGDLYVIGQRDRTVGLWAGVGGVAGVGLRISAGQLPLGIATSSGRIGPSVSLGDADAVCVLAHDGALADAAASAVANRIRSASDLEAALEVGRSIDGILGVAATIDGALGAWGAVELVSVGA